MKFAAKYELFEAITGGPVETFVARDLSSRERVLIHIFEHQGQRPDQPPTRWIPESLRSLAPKPPGAVIEAGGYGETSFVYLVTQLPDDLSLQAWVQQYEAHLEETQDVAFTPAKRLSEPSSPHVERHSSLTSPKSAGEFTRIFLATQKESSSITGGFPTPAQSVPSPQADPILGEFQLEDPQSAMPRPADAQPGTFTDIFRTPAKPVAEPSVESFTPTGESGDAKRGEFTNFFRGPFSGERPTQTPQVTPQIQSPEKRPGEFTSIFGPPKSDQSGAQGPLVEPPMARDGGSFTQLFKSVEHRDPPASYQEPAKPHPNLTISSGSTSLVREPVWDSTTPLAPKTEVPPAKPVQPLGNVPNPPPTASPIPLKTEPAPAAAPVAESSAAQPAARSGPSEYTMIISAPVRDTSVPEEPLKPADIPAKTSASPPAAKTAPAPAPQAPKPAQQKSAPPAEKPREEPKNKGITPYLPIILVFTVLFFLALLLVLFFALRH